MSDTARDYQTIEPATTEGLDDFFEPQASTSQASPDQGLATPDQDKTAVSVDEAAKLIGVSTRTVLRRLQKGSLSGFKVQGQFGPEWRVCCFEPQASTSQASPDQGLATPGHPYTAHANDELVAELRQQIADLKFELEHKVSEAQREIQAAAFRNGYLESQLETEREQIKLLTDSQHKPSRWADFKKWFLGQ